MVINFTVSAARVDPWRRGRCKEGIGVDMQS